MGYNTRVYCSKAQRWRRIDVNLMKGRRRPDSRRSIVTWICTQAPDQTCYFERVHGNNGQTYYFSEATYNTLSSRKKTEQCNLGALALPAIPRYLQKGAWAFNDLMATVMLKAEEVAVLRCRSPWLVGVPDQRSRGWSPGGEAEQISEAC
ncbi:hypothetical protein OsI_27711 [Oryza sativa Indica Group]|uniref:Uncharacterized protein n=3 Tax=Oryza TaxID=4527 RepID=A3BPD4_ORYSJ|nr:hypothetical protein OsI_27711 [Oryza sativa Indica Group]EAZ41423.1 hypothetical protein OsJ_25945 [Oryza sativa Japonica Group]